MTRRVVDPRFKTTYISSEHRVIREGQFFGPLGRQLYDAMQLYQTARLVPEPMYVFGKPTLTVTDGRVAAYAGNIRLLGCGMKLELLALRLRHLQLELRAFTVQRDLIREEVP